MITGQATHQALARGFTIGMRFHSAQVLQINDAKPVHLGHAALADGRWRLYAFAGTQDAGLRGLCRFLEESADSPVRRFTPPGQDGDAVFDLRAVFQLPHTALAIESMPALLRPAKGRFGLYDYEKVYSAVLKHAPDIYDLRGIDRQQGALVVVRPDQYVAHVLSLDAHQALAQFFAGFMRQA